MAVPTRQSIEIALLRIAPQYDISRVYLFGSVARGSATEGSDADLCLETGPSFSLFNAGAFCMAMQDALGTQVDIVTERSAYPHIRSSMLKERVLAYER